MDNEHILKTFESIGIPRMQTLVYLDLLKNKESSVLRELNFSEDLIESLGYHIT